jgi:hypothetical protein
MQVFQGSPHAWYLRSIVGYPDGFPVWIPRNLSAHRTHFLFAYLAASGYLSKTLASPDRLTVKVRGWGRGKRGGIVGLNCYI